MQEHNRSKASSTSVVWAGDSGFVIVPEYLLDANISDRAFRLFGILASYANREDGRATPSRKTLAAKLSCSQSTLDLARHELVEIGALTYSPREREDGGSTSNEYVLHAVQRTDPSETPYRDSGSPTHEGPVAQEELDPSEQEDHPSDAPPSTEIDAPIEHRAPRPGKVDRKPVTDEEYLLADDVLDCFNRHAGTRFRSADWIAKIIMRLREHPGSTLDQHEQVIKANLAEPWWRGPASPSVIYGSGAQFERSIATVEQPSNPDKPMTEEELAAWVRGDA